MRTESAFGWIRHVVLWASLLALSIQTASAAEEVPPFLDDHPPPPFDRVRMYYINTQARPFVQDLALQERFLVSLIDQIAQELNERGIEGWERSKVGFDLVYRRADSLSREYAVELQRFLGIASALDSLERRALLKERLDLAWGIRDLKSRISAALDNPSLNMDEAQRRLFLLRRVNYEINRLVEIYDKFEELQKDATSRGRYDLVAKIDDCQEEIVRAISTWGRTEPVDPKLVDEYIYELSRLVKILRELDKLQEMANGISPTVEKLVSEAKASLLAELSPEVLEAFGYTQFSRGDNIPLSELLQEWEKSEWVDYELARTFYEIIYQKLLETGTPAERERMLVRALEYGVDAYASGQYSLAELHFSHALQVFPDYGFDLTPVEFYRSECLFALGHYGEAADGFRTIAFANQPDPKYGALSALRLITLAHLNQQTDMGKAYRIFSRFADTLSTEDRADGYFLTGLWYLQNGRPLDAAGALARVPEGTGVSVQARFLRGVALSRINDYESAKRIFVELAKLRDAPGRGYFEAAVGNAALVKLGFIAYENGDFQQAIDYFERVSGDYPDYDQALLGAAWTYLKLGDYQSAGPAAEEIAQRFIQSEYVYEALVLAAHCKRILGQQEDALENLRYVTNARAVEDLAREWGRERLRLARARVALDSLERVIVERGDSQLYPQLLEAKEQTEFALWLLEHPGPAGVRLLQEFNSERSRIATLLTRLDRLRQAATQLGRKDVVHKADKAEHRLLRTLETYQSDFAITRVNHFVDYPLALRESTSRYVAALLDSMRNEAAEELGQMTVLRAKADSLRMAADRLGREDVVFEAEYWSDRLRDIAADLNWAQGWIATRDIQVIDADFNRWADFSGFGMSDITLTLLRDREQKLTRYSEYIQAIDRILAQRKENLERSLTLLSERIQDLEFQLQQLRLAEMRKKREKYFEQEYFDRSTSEQPPAESKNRPENRSEQEGTGEDATGRQ